MLAQFKKLSIRKYCIDFKRLFSRFKLQSSFLTALKIANSSTAKEGEEKLCKMTSKLLYFFLREQEF